MGAIFVKQYSKMYLGGSVSTFAYILDCEFYIFFVIRLKLLFVKVIYVGTLAISHSSIDSKFGKFYQCPQPDEDELQLFFIFEI